MILIFSKREIDISTLDVENKRVDLNSFDEKEALSSEFFLIDSEDSEYTQNCANKIRQSQIPEIYLKPIIFLSPIELEKDIKLIADLTFSLDSFINFYHKEVIEKIDKINSKISMIPDKELPTDKNIAFKILRFMYVRNLKLSPIRGVYSKFGYHYPKIDIFINEKDEGIFQILNFLEQQRLIKGDFFDKSHFCSNCYSPFLNFREVCPHCKSANLKTEDLIHHFHCAYVGSEDDFKEGNKMVCPKCKRELKHIGVDFDKPSIVYICNECSHTFQDPEIDTICFNCERRAMPENQNIKEIKHYSLTALAENSAIFGLDTMFASILEKELNIIPMNFFKEFVSVEVERIKRYKKSVSSLALLLIEDLDKIYIEFGERAKDIFSELSIIIKSVLRTSDVITSLNDSIFIMLLVETPKEGAEIAMNKRLKSRIEELLQNNLKKTPNLVIKVAIIDGEVEAEKLIEEVVESVMGEKKE